MSEKTEKSSVINSIMSESDLAVSYTHLDVYKRQGTCIDALMQKGPNRNRSKRI